MASTHKNKTLATFLASTLGGLGIHRFYLHGWKDVWAWVHLFSVPISAFAGFIGVGLPLFFIASPFLVSVLAGFIEALVIGLTPDDKWDAVHNRDSGQQSCSGWPVALLLVLTLGVGATALIATIARLFDLVFTGGAYG